MLNICWPAACLPAQPIFRAPRREGDAPAAVEDVHPWTSKAFRRWLVAQWMMGPGGRLTQETSKRIIYIYMYNDYTFEGGAVGGRDMERL